MQLTPSSNISALTGVRFWAALMVVLFHFAAPGIPQHDYIIDEIINRGSLGVDLFFVLSGYIIHHVYGKKFSARIKREEYISFLSYRIARMYPVHLFTLALMYALYGVAVIWFHKIPLDNASYQFTSLLQNLLLVHAWFGTGSPNIPAWSISSEWFMYLLYPLVALLLFRLSSILEFVMLLLCLVSVHFFAPLHPITHILPEFIFGATLYQLNTRLNLAQKLSCYTGYALVIAIMTVLTMAIDYQALYVLLFGLLILSLTSQNDLLGDILSAKACIYLGEISYSLYMVHSFVWSVLKNMFRIFAPSLDFQSVPIVLGGVFISLLASAFVYHAIEVPGRRWIRELVNKGRNRRKTR